MTDHPSATKMSRQFTPIVRASAASGGFIGFDGDELIPAPFPPWLRRLLEHILLDWPKPPQPDPYIAVGRPRFDKPEPDPWRTTLAVRLGRAIADRAIGLRLDGALLGGEVGKVHAEGAASLVNTFVEDYCGTPPRHKLPLPLRGELELSHAEQMLIAAQFWAGSRIGDVAALARAAERIAAY